MNACKYILLIEDDRDDETLALKAIEQNNIADSVVVARDGAQALELLRANRDLPSLVLLDLDLPRLHGLEVLRSIRADARTAAVPVVILSSADDDRDVACGRNLGAGFIRKPLDCGRLLAFIRMLGCESC